MSEFFNAQRESNFIEITKLQQKLHDLERQIIDSQWECIGKQWDS